MAACERECSRRAPRPRRRRRSDCRGRWHFPRHGALRQRMVGEVRARRRGRWPRRWLQSNRGRRRAAGRSPPSTQCGPTGVDASSNARKAASQVMPLFVLMDDDVPALYEEAAGASAHRSRLRARASIDAHGERRDSGYDRVLAEEDHLAARTSNCIHQASFSVSATTARWNHRQLPERPSACARGGSQAACRQRHCAGRSVGRPRV